MKAMLLSFQAGLHSSIIRNTTRLDIIEECTEHVKSQICDIAKAHNEMVDVYEKQAEWIQKLQLKVVDLEDRSRNNNLKFRGISESVKPRDLLPYLKQLLYSSR